MDEPRRRHADVERELASAVDNVTHNCRSESRIKADNEDGSLRIRVEERVED
jgi:hypothetical protein